jgi:hypothetical protein
MTIGSESLFIFLMLRDEATSSLHTKTHRPQNLSTFRRCSLSLNKQQQTIHRAKRGQPLKHMYPFIDVQEVGTLHR